MLKSKLNLALFVVLLSARLTVALGQEPTPLLTQTEDKWIAVLKSGASQKDKADACRELAVIGTRASVPVLAGMLADEKMNHMARYALETIPDLSVDEALRAALGKLNGRPLVGVIGSVGVRRDAGAIDALARFLSNPDSAVVRAAARSLGRIGGLAATLPLEDALAKSSGDNQLAVCEGLFRCAEAFLAAGRRAEAGEIYDRLRKSNAAHQVRAGGLRGAVLAQGSKGLPLLLEALRSDDWIMVGAGAKTAMEMSGGSVTKAVAGELGKGSADRQILLIQVLGRRGDAAALPALQTAAKQGDPKVRLTAIRALAEIGSASAANALIESMGDSDREISQAAQESLASLPGSKVDSAILSLLKSKDLKQQLAAIDLIARRRMLGAMPELLKAATGKDEKIRSAVMRKVGELGSTAEMPALFEALKKATGSADLDAIEEALRSVCTKAEKPESCTEKVTAQLAKASPDQKGVLLRVLSAIGGPAALQTVRAAVNDSNAEVHSAAIRALGAWRTGDAGPALLALARDAANPTDRMLCLRSYLWLAGQSELPVAARISMCKEAAGLLKNAQEKKMLLGTLGAIQTQQSIALLVPYLKDADVKNEAAAGVVGIVDSLLQGKNGAKLGPKLADPLKQVIQANANPDVTKRANALLQKAQPQRGKQ